MLYVWRTKNDELLDYRQSCTQPRLIGQGIFEERGIVTKIPEGQAVEIVGRPLERGEIEVVPKRGSGEPE